MAKPHLISLSYSPWSERARWALDHHKVRYRRSEHLPMVGEPLLRLRARRLTGRVTVPLLMHDGAVITDSYDIARYAETVGSGEPLFPTQHIAAIEAWNRTSDETLALARSIITFKTGASAEAKQEALPPFVPAALRRYAEPVAAMGVAFFVRKYRLDASAVERATEGIEKTLKSLREALSGRPTLFETFTFADIAMATVLQAVEPVDNQFIRLGPGTRACWTMPDLADRYRDLVEWRDGLYAEKRGRRMTKRSRDQSTTPTSRESAG